MKNTTLIILTVFGSLMGFAQESEMPDRSWGAGFQLGEWGNDFGYGVTVNSPEFWNVLTIDAAYQQQFRSSYIANNREWERYGVVELGARAKGGQITPWFHVYGYGRINMLVYGPADWTTPKLSGSGGFGFEFNTSGSGKSPVSYFIELGGRGGFHDVAPAYPAFAGGFSTSVGFRAYF